MKTKVIKKVKFFELSVYKIQNIIKIFFVVSFTFYLMIDFCFCQSNSTNKIIEPTKVLEKNEVEYAYPHWSKDAKQILFQSNESGKWQIYKMNENGSNIIKITKDTANNNFIDYSPDNKKIAFVSDKTGNEEIFIMDADGSNQKQLTYNKGRDIHPYFTPNGNKLFFNSTRDDTTGAFEIYEMNLDGSNVQRITNTPDDETCVHQSSKENKIIYLKNNRQGLDDVFLKDLETNQETNLTNTKSTDGWPTWLPDGKGIIYSAKEDDIYKLFIYNLKTKRLRKITNPSKPFYDARPNVSPDGRKIVFNRQSNGKSNTIGIYILNLKH